MGLYKKIEYQVLKYTRMAWYNIRYNINKWQLLEGVWVPVYLRYGYSVIRFMAANKYEEGEIGIIKETLTNSDKVLELGTGIGFVSTFCAKKIGGEKIYTFEANPSLKPSIEEIYARNNVKPNSNFALLGEGEGTKIFYQNQNSFLASSTKDGLIENAVKIEIPQKDLNKTIAEIQPTYLIMDIEGGEYEVFRYISFQSIRKIQFELHPVILGPQKVKEIFDILSANNFRHDKNLLFPNNFYFTKD
jgi:FkbM family methyltransferase